jgi:predicted transcriptional regulator
MRTVIIGVDSLDSVKQRLREAFKGKKQASRLSFASLDLMHRILTPNRWRMLQVMMSAGPVGPRELARRLDRDVKSVHTDIQALLNAGIIDRVEGGKVEFPYDAARVDFTVAPEVEPVEP